MAADPANLPGNAIGPGQGEYKASTAHAALLTWPSCGAAHSRQSIAEEGGNVLLVGSGRQAANVDAAGMPRCLLGGWLHPRDDCSTPVMTGQPNTTFEWLSAPQTWQLGRLHAKRIAWRWWLPVGRVAAPQPHLLHSITQCMTPVQSSTSASGSSGAAVAQQPPACVHKQSGSAQ